MWSNVGLITFDDIKCYQMLLNAGSITLMLSNVGVITLITLMLLHVGWFTFENI